MRTNNIASFDDKQTMTGDALAATALLVSQEINATAAAEVLHASANTAEHLHQLLRVVGGKEKRLSSELANVTAPELLGWADQLEEWSQSHYLAASDNTNLFKIAEQLAGASAGLESITVYFNAISELARAENNSGLPAQIAYAGYCLARDTAQHLAAVADSFYTAHKEQGGVNEQ